MADEDPKRKRLGRLDVTYFIAMAFAVLIIRDLWVAQSHMKTIPYSEFRGLVEQNTVTDLVIGPTIITGTYKAAGAKGQEQHFSTVRVDADLASELQRRGIKYGGEPPPGLLQGILSWILPTALFVLAWMFVLRPMASGAQGGLMGIGRSKAKIYSEPSVKVTFADVAGVDEAKAELSEIIGFLRDPIAYGRLGARIPKGVLLVGPPGTGKTLLRARSRARRESRSSRSPVPNSSRCSSASAPRGSATCSPRRASRRRRSCSSTSSTRSAARAASTWPAAA